MSGMPNITPTSPAAAVAPRTGKIIKIGRQKSCYKDRMTKNGVWVNLFFRTIMVILYSRGDFKHSTACYREICSYSQRLVLNFFGF